MATTTSTIAMALLLCIGAASAAMAADGKAARHGVQADGTSCAFTVAQGASPAARCAAIRRQCGGKFFANYCGDKLPSAM
jgi:hypothetical protein